MSIAQRIHGLLEQDPSAHPSTIAAELAVSEWEVVRHLPAELVTLVPAEQAECEGKTTAHANLRRVYESGIAAENIKLVKKMH